MILDWNLEILPSKLYNVYPHLISCLASMKYGGGVYIMSGLNNSTLYVGVTSHALKKPLPLKNPLTPSAERKKKSFSTT